MNINKIDSIENADLHVVSSHEDVVDGKRKELVQELSGNPEKMQSIDKVQFALDVIGFEPTYGSLADATNVVISGLRAALADESDMRKKHLFNAAISAVSLIPFADVVKILKLRKSPKIAKAAIGGARAVKRYAKNQKRRGDRFNSKESSPEELSAIAA